MSTMIVRRTDMQQQRNVDSLKELAMKSRVREDVGRKRAGDPRDRSVDRSLISDRGVLERDILPDRPAIIESVTVGDRAPNAALSPDRMLERDIRSVERDGVRDVSHVERGGGPERVVKGLGRERVEESATERSRPPDRDVVGNGRIVERDSEREESMRELVSSYKSALAELSFNSKPIITNLTIIAGENSHAAKGISSTIFNHIMEVPKDQKLPSLYLLDSIVKNIGGEYIKYFAARLPEVFCTAYRQVDPTTNPAMQHLFKTWRGVFPAAPLRLIENELQLSSVPPNGHSGVAPIARPPESPTARRGQDPPMPRAGHGIHVNPKYLEAQRQRLRQTEQAGTIALGSNGSSVIREPVGSSVRETSKEWSDTLLKGPAMPTLAKRDDYMETGFRRDSPFDAEYDDYPNSNLKSTPARGLVGEEGWEPGYFRDGDGEGVGHEGNLSSQYGPRNVYNWRQPPSRSRDRDGFGYNRAPGVARGGFFRTLQNPRPSAGGRKSADNWLKTDEEEFVWEDMSPRLRPPPMRRDDRNGEVSKDWYPGESTPGIMASESGHLRRISQDTDFVNNTARRRDGAGVPMDQSRRSLKEYEAGRGMQPNNGRGSGVLGVLDPSSGAAQPPILGARPHIGWQPLGINIRNLSPPARSLPGPLQLSAPSSTISPTPQAPSNLLPRAGTPPTPSNSVSASLHNGHFESQQTSRANIGNFVGVAPFNSGLSSVTPISGLPFLQRTQPQRHPPSPTQLSAHQSHHQQISSHVPSQIQNQQSHTQQQHEQSSNLHTGRNQMQVSLHMPSTQQLPQGLQTPSLQQVPKLVQGAHQLHQQPLQHGSMQQGHSGQQSSHVSGLDHQQRQSNLHQAQVPTQQPLLHQPQAQSQPGPQLSAPLLPLISSQLAQSLQQLAHQSQLQAQQSQLALVHQKQPQTSQELGILSQSLPTGSNGPSRLLQASESQSTNTNILTAFVQSGLIPPSQSAQILSQSQAVSSRTSASLQPNPTQSAFQGLPPLPSGPPPGQYPSSVQTGVTGRTKTTASSTLNQMTSFSVPTLRYTQPPLPPGPPPASTVVGSAATTTTTPPGGFLSSSISSILSSLVAHGVIAPVQDSSTNSTAPGIIGGLTKPDAILGFTPVSLLTSSESPPSLFSTPTAVPSVPGSTISASVVSICESLPNAPKIVKEVMDTEFKPEVLRERHEYVIEALYSDFPRQCKTCGLRFTAQDEHSKHMDWHVSRNRRQRPPKKISRKWFASLKDWLSGTLVAASEFAPSFFVDDPGVQDDDHELVAVLADDNQSTCALCGEQFDDFYSDETDEWMYKGAVYLNIPHGGSIEGLDISDLGPIVHLKCKTESAEITPVDAVEDVNEVQPELQAADSVRMEVDGLGEDVIMPLLTENFELSEAKELQEELGRRKRTRY